MALEFSLPDVGEGVAEGEIVEWLVDPGDSVAEDQPVVEVETDKAVVEVPSPVNGTVRELRAEAGEVVPVGEVIIVFEVEGEAPDDPTEAVEPEPADEGAGEAGVTEAAASENQPASDDGRAGRVFAAPSARRLARELGVDLGSVEGSGPGGRVTERDVRVAAESGAADADGTGAPPDGTGEAAEEREAALAEAEESLGGAQSGVTTGTQPTTENTGAPAPAERDRTLAAPATRGVARELGVDIDEVPAVEQRDGEAFVTAEAVQQYAAAQQRAQAADAAAVSRAGGEADAAEPSAVGDRVAEDEIERVPYRGVRRTIGQQMERSKYTAPHVTHHDRVEVTGLVAARDDLKARADERGITLTYLPFVIKAVVAALREYPILNSQLDEENEEIRKKGYYNIGVATATDAGLMVPVVENAGRKSLLEIASEANELVQKARDRSIAREEMQGGTFTITNFGAIGGEYATPIINYPETAILGLGAIKKRPWVVDSEARSASDSANGETVSGAVEPRQVMTLSLSIDHRVVDGAEAARFTNTLKEYLRDPTLLLLE